MRYRKESDDCGGNLAVRIIQTGLDVADNREDRGPNDRAELCLDELSACLANSTLQSLVVAVFEYYIDQQIWMGAEDLVLRYGDRLGEVRGALLGRV